MEPAVSELFNMLGTSGIFLAGCWYLMQRMEKKDEARAKEALERERRLVTLVEVSEDYIRKTLAETVDRNTTAMTDNARALTEASRSFENLPCGHLRHGELKPLLESAGKRTGERR